MFVQLLNTGHRVEMLNWDHVVSLRVVRCNESTAPEYADPEYPGALYNVVATTDLPDIPGPGYARVTICAGVTSAAAANILDALCNAAQGHFPTFTRARIEALIQHDKLRKDRKVGRND